MIQYVFFTWIKYYMLKNNMKIVYKFLKIRFKIFKKYKSKLVICLNYKIKKKKNLILQIYNMICKNQKIY